MWTAKFWKQTAERAIKTFAQTFVAAIGTEQVAFGEVNWLRVLSVSGVAALLSVMTSLAPLGPKGTPSLVE